jgi:hypothetical protein
MPSTLWSAPAAPSLGPTSLTTSSFTASTLSDISPYASLVEPGSLNLGTRVRITAIGSYTGTSTTVTLQYGLYVAVPNTAIASALNFSLTPAITVFSGTGVPWIIQYFGHVAAVSVNINNTSASLVGRGYHMGGSSGTIGTAGYTVNQMPQTLAAVTVAQTSATNLNTMVELNILLGVTPGASVTNLTNIIVDELTCELLG